TQKYFRVLTRHGADEARICVVLPSGLPALPILPTELFGRSLREYVCGDLIGEDASEPAKPSKPVLAARRHHYLHLDGERQLRWSASSGYPHRRFGVTRIESAGVCEPAPRGLDSLI
ncbi:hypothetical protein ACFL5O_09590, partial [Myxococcota bacterium]